MLASNLIRNDFKPLQPEDRVFMAHEIMDEMKLTHLPVLDNGEYIGLVSENDLLDNTDDNRSIKDGSSKLIRVSMMADKHLFDAINMMSEFNLSMLPILDFEEKYIGYITPKEIIMEMGGLLSTKIPGSILVLEMNQSDYHMSQIAQIVESNDSKILASYFTADPDSVRIEVTLRINRKDLTGIIQTFQRYDYNISATFHESFHAVDYKDRYDNFMKYLNM